MTMAVKMLKNHKTKDKQYLRGELVKYSSKKFIEKLTSLIANIWKSKKIPSDWRIVLIMLLHKKKSPRNMDNYRTLGIVGAIVKVYTTILSMRVYPYYHNNVSKEQFANKIGNGTLEAMMTTQRVIEDCIKNGQKIYLTLVDLKKAFDSMDRNITWETLKLYKIPIKIIELIKDVYSHNSNWIFLDGQYSEENVEINRGVRQGCVLSSMLFCIMFDYVVNKSLNNHRGITYEYDKEMRYHGGNERHELKKIIYADDIIIISRDIIDVKQSLRKLNNNVQRCGMRISFKKTMIIRIGQPECNRKENETINICGKQIEVVNTTTHLGRIIENGSGKTMRHKDNLTNRLNKARGCYMRYYHSLWKNKYINIKLKMKLFDSLVMSVLLYSLETIPKKKIFEDRVRTFLVKCYKQILNIHPDIRIQENDLVQILGVENTLMIWKKKRISTVNHIARLPYDNPARIVLFGKPIYINTTKNRKFKTMKQTLYSEIDNLLTKDEYCNLCDRKFRSASLHQASTIS